MGFFVGCFLELGAVLANEKDVVEAAKQLEVKFKCLETLATMSSIAGKTLLFLDEKGFGASDAIKELSRVLETSSFYFHVHDGDLWMYEFYVNGLQRDQFNTCPDYWEEISEEEKLSWKGSSAVLAENWLGVNKDEIENYLVDLPYDDDRSHKAYEDDEFDYGDIWQLTDFMKKLGVPYPDDEEDPEEEASERFEVDMDSLFFLGIGLYGTYLSTQMQGGIMIGAYSFAFLLITSAIVNAFRKKIGKLLFFFTMLILVGISIFFGLKLGFHLKRFIIIASAVYGVYIYYNAYKEEG